MRENETGPKWLPASRLIELLSSLPPDSRIMPNAAGNLLVLAADSTDSIAYVDFRDNGKNVSMTD